MRRFEHKLGRKGKQMVSILLCALLLLGGLAGCASGAGAGADASVAPIPAYSELQDELQAGSASQAALAESEPEPEPEPVEHRVKFSAVGDNLIHNSIYDSAKARTEDGSYDFSFAYEHVVDYFKAFDVNWINQETLVNSELAPSSYPMFSTPGELGQAAYDAGWRVYALANNHTYDKGAAGIAATRRYWAAMPDDVVTYGLFTGYDDDSGIAVQEVNGISIAYVAFAESTNGLPTPADTEAFVIYTSERDAMEAKVRRAREMADLLVVSVHWGVENSHNVTQAQRDLALDYADWGADIVLGTHPHVVQEIEWIQSPADGRDVLVAYSLGNFYSAQSQPDQLFGLILQFDVVQTEQPDGTKTPISIQDVKADIAVTHYHSEGRAYYVEPRVYLLRDYTDELAAKHPARSINGAFGPAYIAETAKQYVAEEFLSID